MRCARLSLSLLFLFFSAVWSQEALSIDSLCDLGLTTLSDIDQDNQNLRRIIESLNRDLESDKISIMDSKEALAISNSKLEGLNQTIVTLKIDLQSDEDTLKRQAKLLTEQATAYESLERSYSLSKRLNKTLTIGLCVAVPIIVGETYLLLR